MDRFSIDLGRSLGHYAFDMESRSYFFDMHNMFSSIPLGYNHPSLTSKQFKEELAVVAQVKTSRCKYATEQEELFLKSFKEFAVPPGFEHMYFCSTGSLAVEAAIKTAWHCNKNRSKNILVGENSFHGINSVGMILSHRNSNLNGRLNGVPKADFIYHFDYQNIVLPPDFIFRDFAAVIVEPIQCTAGDIFPNVAVLQELRNKCTEYGIPLIFDEIQTGFCTTGHLWYYQALGIEPDIIIFGKKAQTSGILVKSGFGAIFNDPWRLTVTYDGDLVDMLRCRYIIDVLKQEGTLSNILNTGEFFQKQLKTFCPEIENIRGIGCIVAFDFPHKEQRDDFITQAYENNLLCNFSGDRTVRLRPNLMFSNQAACQAASHIGRALYS